MIGPVTWQMIGRLAGRAPSLTQEPTKAGRAAAKARGVRMGRKPLPSAQQIAYARKPVKLGSPPGAVASELKVSQSIIDRA